MDHMVPYDDHLAVLGGVEPRGEHRVVRLWSRILRHRPMRGRRERRPRCRPTKIEGLHRAAKQTEWLEAIELLGTAVEPDAELHRLLPVWSACVGAGPAARGGQNTVEVLD